MQCAQAVLVFGPDLRRREVFRLLLPLSWLFLLAAVGSRLWHLSMRVDVARISVAHVSIGEDLTSLHEAQLKGAGVYMTGPDVKLGPQQLPEAIKLHAAEVEKIQHAIEELNSRGKWAALVRNAFLLLGLTALTAWKILNL